MDLPMGPMFYSGIKSWSCRQSIECPSGSLRKRWTRFRFTTAWFGCQDIHAVSRITR